MANLGLSNTHVGSSAASAANRRLIAARALAGKKRLQTAFHVMIFFAAFIFVAALVCGLVG